MSRGSARFANKLIDHLAYISVINQGVNVNIEFATARKLVGSTAMVMLVIGAGLGLGAGVAQAKTSHPPHPTGEARDPDQGIDKHQPNSGVDTFLDTRRNDPDQNPPPA